MKENKKKMINIVKIVFIVVLAVGLIHIINGLVCGRKMYTVNVPVKSPKIVPELSGYKIAFVTDTHKMDDENLDELTESIEAAKPDLILLGGDFGGGEYTRKAVEKLSRISTTDGIYGVQGNHDNAQRLYKIMRENHINILNNNGEQIRNELYIGGVSDFWHKKADISKAIEGAQPDDYVILLCHNPDLTMFQSTKNVDLTLSGHTHGGEINFFGVFSPALLLTPDGYGVTQFNQKFQQGWCKSADDTPVYVSRGVGSHTKFRVFSPAEITILELGN